MGLLLQYLLNVLLTWSEAALLGYAFFLTYIGCRHVAFAIAGAFVAGPYVWWLLARASNLHSLAIAGSIAGLAITGLLYRRFAACLLRRGSEPEHLVLVSLSLFGAAEALLTFAFGSQDIWVHSPVPPHVLGRFLGTNVTLPQLIVLGIGGGLVAVIALLWRSSNLGRAARGLLETREGMMIRGFRVVSMEGWLTMTAFATACVAGLLRVVDGRMLKPSSGLDAGIIGVVAFIAGLAISRGVAGVAAAGLLIAIARLGLQFLSAGDWSRAAPLLVLLAVLAVRRSKLAPSAAGA